MRPLKHHLSILLLATFAVAAPAAAQSRQEGTVLPVWNSGNGRVEALLVLEPASGSKRAGPSWGLGSAALSSTFGLTRGDSLGLLCSGSQSAPGLNALASNCLLATLDGDGRNLSTGVSLSRGNLRGAVQLGNQRLPLGAAFQQPSGIRNPAARIEQTDLTVHGQKDIGREGYVSLAGTYAKARLVPLADASPAVASRWDSKSLSVGAGYGPFSANVVGRVIEVPGQLGKWEGLGLGITWRTPWSGQLTVGADNVVSRGKNPFAPRNVNDDEDTVPYVRYQQDL